MIFIVLSDVCRVFVLLTALGQKSLTGQSASEVIESILMLLGKLLSPLLAVSQLPRDVYYRSASSQYILRSVMFIGHLSAHGRMRVSCLLLSKHMIDYKRFYGYEHFVVLTPVLLRCGNHFLLKYPHPVLSAK